MLSFFEECLIVFQAPAELPKNQMPRVLLSIAVNFGCSSYQWTLMGCLSNVVENRVTSETTPYKPNNLELYYTCVERADAHSENSSHVDYKRIFSKRPVLF